MQISAGDQVRQEGKILAINMHRPLALITGASSGVAYELARKFYQQGFDLLPVAKDTDVGVSGEFNATDLHTEIDLIHLNVVSAVHACRHNTISLLSL